MRKVDLLIEYTASCFLILKKIKLCDLQKAITQYMLLETKYKMKRYILKIGKNTKWAGPSPAKDYSINLQEFGLSPFAFQNPPAERGLNSFYSTHQVFVEKKTLKNMGENTTGIYCFYLEANVCKYHAIKPCF